MFCGVSIPSCLCPPVILPFFSHPPLFVPPLCSVCICSLIVGALQSAARGTLPLAALQPLVWWQLCHCGEDDTALFPAWNTHR